MAVAAGSRQAAAGKGIVAGIQWAAVVAADKHRAAAVDKHRAAAVRKRRVAAHTRVVTQ